MKNRLSRLLPGFTWKRLGLLILGAAISSFGLYNVHQQCGITEGGALGAVLLLYQWFGIPASISTPLIDLSCYALAMKALGGSFIRWSLVSTVCATGAFRLFELWPPVLPDLSDKPLLAAVVGALFVGIGVGMVVRQGGSAGGDDALALSISHFTGVRVAKAYLFTDLTVLALSLSYIPAKRIAYSLVTVTISSWLIDLIHGAGKNVIKEP